MSHSPFFSIVIPTYNVEQYITRCLESCINQTFSDIEILIVDDCGSDDSLQIAQGFADKDSRIRIIHNPRNLGLFGARLSGEREAKGEYILPLDSDDYLELNTCELLHRKIISRNLEYTPDIIHFKAHYLGDKNAGFVENCKHKLRYLLPTRFSRAPLQNEQIAYNFFLKSKQFPKFTLWDKCYKASLLKQSALYLKGITRPLTMAEDMLKFFVIASLAKSYTSINNKLYVYCLNHSSITQRADSADRKINDMLFIMENLDRLSTVLSGGNSYMPQISTRMRYNLASLVLLELRFKNSPIIFADSGKSATIQCQQQALILPPLPKNGFFIRTLKRIATALNGAGSTYLASCVFSLMYWNRILTYIRIFGYIVSFGRVRL